MARQTRSDRLGFLPDHVTDEGQLVIQPQVPLGTGWAAPAKAEVARGVVRTKGHGRMVDPTPTLLLDRFMALADRTDKKVAKFVQRYGALGLCEAHALPSTHAPGCGTKQSRGWAIEPLDGYAQLARLFDALLRLGGYLKAEPPLPRSRADWHTVVSTPLFDFSEDHQKRLIDDLGQDDSRDATFLMVALNLLLVKSNARPRFFWTDDGGPRVEVVGTTLFQALALSLAFNITAHPGLRSCIECGAPVQRTAKTGAWPKYCRSCRTQNVPQRRADERRRGRRS